MSVVNAAAARTLITACTTLSLEDKAGLGFGLEPSESSYLVATKRVNARLAVLARRTCKYDERPHSTCDHSKSQIPEARRPCQKATSTNRKPQPAWERRPGLSQGP